MHTAHSSMTEMKTRAVYATPAWAGRLIWKDRGDGTSMAGAVMSTMLCLGPKRFFWRVIADSRARHFPRTTCASVSNHQRRFQNQRNKRWAATPPVRWAQRRRTPTCRRSRRKPRSALSTQPGPPLCHQETATRPPSAAVPSSTNKPVGS